MKTLDVTSLDFYTKEKFVVGKILKGGMGSVYQLVPINAGAKPVALKTVQGTASLRAFDIECEAWLSVSYHGNIARAFAFGRWEGMPAVLVDWYPSSLAALKCDQISDQQFWSYLQQTVQALDFAHSEAGLIHQDVKPANILVDDEGSIRLGDFGLARCVSKSARSPVDIGLANMSHVVDKGVSGTPFFMAPELWMGKKPSIRSDIFSLGVTFYFLITGEHPYFEDEKGKQVAKSIRMAPLQSQLRKRGAGFAKFVTVLEKCMALDPAERFQTYKDIGFTGFKNEPHVREQAARARVASTAGKAMLFGDKGEPERAVTLLEAALKEAPDDLTLLGLLAQMRDETGSFKQAEKILSEAFKLAGRTKGIIRGQFVIDPAARWANYLVRHKKFDEAEKVTASILDWADTSALKKELRTVGEVGWHSLFEGEFERAAEHLSGVLTRRSFRKDYALWLVEASWLGNSIEARGDFIARKLLNLRLDVFAKEGELLSAWCLLLVGNFSNPGLRNRLWKAGSSFVFSETLKAEKAMGFRPGSLLQPEGLEAQKYIVGQLDTAFTGGRHCELIRSISEPRLA